MNLKGKVLWYCKRDGYGIIRDDIRNEFYVDKSVLLGIDALERGQIVEFNHNRDIVDCLCAKDVKNSVDNFQFLR